MKTNTALRRLMAGSSFALGLASTTLAADTTATVPRAEYDQLKQQLSALTARLDAMSTTAAQTTAAAPAAPEASDPKGTRRRAVLNLTDFKPGWQRFRSSDWTWMDHDRYDEMNALIAQGAGFELFAGMTSAGRFQALQQKSVVTAGKTPARLEPGFQTAWGSFEFLADFDRQIEVYFDVYLSTKAHPSQLQGHEGYMLMRGLPDSLADTPGLKSLFSVANVKAGQFDIDFGDHRYRRTDNARGQRNPFVGNTLFDPSATEVGVEVFRKPGDNGTLHWLVGVGSGSEQGSFEAERGMGAHAKTWVNFDNLRLSASAYYLDHERSSTSFSNLYRASRSGGQYNGIFDNGNAPGSVFVGVGKTLTAYQVDATWYRPNYELYSHVGSVQEKAPTGDENWYYATFDGVLRLTERLYADARYNVGFADKLRGIASEGRIDRFQIGGGYWLFKPILLKVEYVNERLSGFKAAEGAVSGVEAWRKPSFQGVVAEFTFSY
jgi:hypothetical protein